MTIAVAALLMVVIQFISQSGQGARFAQEIFWAEVLLGIVVFVLVSTVGPLALCEMKERRIVAAEAQEARRQIELLFRMTDMLQSALGYADANAVLRTTAAQLLPGFGGSLYIFNNSRDRLDLSTVWGWPEDRAPQETVSPNHCWALKRGKKHLNPVHEEALRCEHHAADLSILEIPMMARGEVYGLLNILAHGPEPDAQLREAARVAGAIADAMSLALSNIALREKLRTQALRDPLTGLYNRRYMEDVLERYVNLAQRNGSAVSAIMIDLDHFKRLNDEHGHAVGDAVLREAASAIAGAIRPCDVACRYGGEELVVLMPDCHLADAALKAEILRARIESLSENHGTRVTASFGVASMSEGYAKGSDLLNSADKALYRAKQEGRNRVAVSPRRDGSTEAVYLSAAAE